MITVKISLKGLEKHYKALGQSFKHEARKGIVSGALRALPLLHTRARTAKPASPKGQVGAFNTGDYARGWKSEPTPTGALVFNLMPYSGVIEFGRRRGARPPPLAPIAHWLQRRAGLSKSEAEGAAFPVSKAIGKRGLRARRVLTGARKEITRFIHEEIRRALDRAMSGLGVIR
jgi:hypothetical protein